jgi:hypothetical protein
LPHSLVNGVVSNDDTKGHLFRIHFTNTGNFTHSSLQPNATESKPTNPLVEISEVRERAFVLASKYQNQPSSNPRPLS